MKTPSDHNNPQPDLSSSDKNTRVGLRNRTDTMIAAHTEVEPVDIAIDTIRLLLEEMTDEPEKVQFVKRPGGLKVLNLEMWVNRTDFGHVLGKQRKYLEGLRAVCKMLSSDEQDVQLTLHEIAEGQKRNRPPFSIDDNWPAERVEQMFQRVFDILFERHGGAKVTIDSQPGGVTVVDVVVSDRVSDATAVWLSGKLEPLVVMICSRNKRAPASLKIHRDQMLFDQWAGETAWNR
jgi:predicted RNA-binding protein YlqC (UPF0109 family)